jgi:hypothetical protein
MTVMTDQNVTISRELQGRFSLIRSVMTEDQEQELISIGQDVSGLQWRAGDLVNEIYTQVVAHKLELTIMDVCHMISESVYGEYAPNTLRIYAAVAKFYPVHVRAQIPEIIPFSIFRYATQFKDEYRKVFEFADRFLAAKGRPPTARELRAYFEPATTMLHDLTDGHSVKPYLQPDEPVEAREIERNFPITHGADVEQSVADDDLVWFVGRMKQRLSQERNPTRQAIIGQILALCNQLNSV